MLSGCLIDTISLRTQKQKKDKEKRAKNAQIVCQCVLPGGQDGCQDCTDRAALLLCAGRMERPEETGAGTLTDEKRVQNGVLDRMCGKMMCEIG